MHDLNKLGKCRGTRSCGFKQDFFMFSLCPCKTCDPCGRAIFDTGGGGEGGENLNKLGKGPLEDDACQISGLKALWLWTKIFSLYEPMFNM